MTPRAIALAGLTVAFVVGARFVLPDAAARADLPDRLTDQDFWRLTVELSEPNGSFRSDNLLSNELRYPDVLDDLIASASAGDVDLGVGPEQNFHYLAAIRPKMAFVVDVRRGNLQLQLMYKALFELSTDRADFVSRLFTKKRPEGLGPRSTAADLMNAYWDYASSSSGTVGGRATYGDLMMSVDAGGHDRGYLSSEERFAFLKDLEARNLLVPVVGNLAGPKVLRAVYLIQDGLWGSFCANVATLPIGPRSPFIRSRGGAMVLGHIAGEIGSCAASAGMGAR